MYRYGGGTRWVDCGSPARCNSVQALAVYDGKLYAGAGRYLSRGSSLPESPNEIPGGLARRERVVAPHLHLRPQLPQEVEQVVGEAIVIVDQ